MYCCCFSYNIFHHSHQLRFKAYITMYKGNYSYTSSNKVMRSSRKKKKKEKNKFQIATHIGCALSNQHVLRTSQTRTYKSTQPTFAMLSYHSIQIESTILVFFSFLRFCILPYTCGCICKMP